MGDAIINFPGHKPSRQRSRLNLTTKNAFSYTVFFKIEGESNKKKQQHVELILLGIKQDFAVTFDGINENLQEFECSFLNSTN